MSNEQLNKEIVDLMIKMTNAINSLKDGKVILAYNKMIGIYQKLQTIAKIIQVQQQGKKPDIQTSQVKVAQTSQGRVIKYGQIKEVIDQSVQNSTDEKLV